MHYHSISKDISYRKRDTNYPEIQKEVLYPQIDGDRSKTHFFSNMS